MRLWVPFWFWVFFVVPMRLLAVFVRLVFWAAGAALTFAVIVLRFVIASVIDWRARRVPDASADAAADRPVWRPSPLPSVVKRFEPPTVRHVGSAMRNARADETRRRLHLD